MEFVDGFAAAAGQGLLMLALARLHWRVPLLVVQVAVALLIHIGAATVLMKAGVLGHYWWFAAAFWFGFMVYLFGFSALYKSLSLRMVVDVFEQSPNGTSLAGVYQRVVERSFRERIEILERGGLVARQGDGYVVTARGRRMAEQIVRLRDLLGVVGGGIYFSER